MLVKTLDKYDLQKEFRECDRDCYSLEAYEALLDLFEELVDTVELDVIAICCDFTEATAEEIISDYSINIEDEDNQLEEVMDYLNHNTYAIQLEDTILYQKF